MIESRLIASILFKHSLKGNSLLRTRANTSPFNYNDDIIYALSVSLAYTHTKLHAQCRLMEEKYTVNTVTALILLTYTNKLIGNSMFG